MPAQIKMPFCKYLENLSDVPVTLENIIHEPYSEQCVFQASYFLPAPKNRLSQPGRNPPDHGMGNFFLQFLFYLHLNFPKIAHLEITSAKPLQ